MSLNAPSRRTRACPGAHRQQTGFTLIEVMVASAFFMAVIGAIFSVHVMSKQVIQKSRNFDRASAILIDMSELTQMLTPTKIQAFLNSGTGQFFTTAGAPVAPSDPNAFFSVTGAIVPGTGTFKQMALTVQWTEPGTAGYRTIASNVLVILP